MIRESVDIEGIARRCPRSQVDRVPELHRRFSLDWLMLRLHSSLGVPWIKHTACARKALPTSEVARGRGAAAATERVWCARCIAAPEGIGSVRPIPWCHESQASLFDR